MTTIAKNCVLVAICVLCVGCNEPASDSTSNAGTSTSQTSATPANANCPIMGGKVTPEGGTVTWNAQTIGFCCEGCSEKWAELSDEEKTQALADTNPDSGTPDADGSDGTSGDSSAS